MPAWNEYKAQATARGALAFELYVAVSTPAKGPEDLRAVLPEHLAYIAQLEKDGVLAFSGPLSDETGGQMEGMGMMVLRAGSMDEARAFAANDPMHTTGTRTFVLRKWLVNEGGLTVNVRLSGQSVTLE